MYPLDENLPWIFCGQFGITSLFFSMKKVNRYFYAIDYTDLGPIKLLLWTTKTQNWIKGFYSVVYHCIIKTYLKKAKIVSVWDEAK